MPVEVQDELGLHSFAALKPNSRAPRGLAEDPALDPVQDRVVEGEVPPGLKEGSPGGAAAVRVPLVVAVAAPVLRAFRDWDRRARC
jgi:hypothetical protein